EAGYGGGGQYEPDGTGDGGARLGPERADEDHQARGKRREERYSQDRQAPDQQQPGQLGNTAGQAGSQADAARLGAVGQRRGRAGNQSGGQAAGKQEHYRSHERQWSEPRHSEHRDTAGNQRQVRRDASDVRGAQRSQPSIEHRERRQRPEERGQRVSRVVLDAGHQTDQYVTAQPAR